MDSVTRALIAFLMLFASGSATAVYPAGIVPMSYCHTTVVNSYKCGGPMFEDEGGAAGYACQQLRGQSGSVLSITKVPSEEVGNGITSWNTLAWNITCTSPTGSPTNHSSAVQALPDCGLNSPVTNYAPASCTGSPPVPPPVACTNTKNVVISAYHPLPALYMGCYAGCGYTATNVVITEYNGVSYESGSWTGAGSGCAPTDANLIGGSPGNSQYVGDGGGLVPGDLANLATEQTLQQLLDAVRAGDLSSGTVANANKVLLEQIAANTLAGSGTGSVTDVPDPDGFEAEFNNRLASTQVDGNGKLPDSAMNGQSVDVGSTFSNVQGFIASSSCPAPPTFSMMGHTYTFDLSVLCGLAEALSYLVVALASLAGAKIFIGGM